MSRNPLSLRVFQPLVEGHVKRVGRLHNHCSTFQRQNTHLPPAPIAFICAPLHYIRYGDRWLVGLERFAPPVDLVRNYCLRHRKACFCMASTPTQQPKRQTRRRAGRKAMGLLPLQRHDRQAASDLHLTRWFRSGLDYPESRSNAVLINWNTWSRIRPREMVSEVIRRADPSLRPLLSTIATGGAAALRALF